jgi:hypothetical protein
MKIKRTVILLSLLATSAMSQNGTATIADLPPELQEALKRDFACETAASATSPEPDQLLQDPIVTQEIRGAAGAEVGMIVAQQGACHCREANCATYVYLKDGPGYRLAFSHIFSSLHPMKVFKRGYPSLTGKMRLDESRAETTVYDWTGSDYQPSLCATITRVKGQKRPAIVKHECANVP